MFGKKDRLFCGQDYKRLKEECVKQGKLFTDPEFPPTSQSLVFSGTPPSGIEWKRPKDLVANPKLFVEGASSNDFSQGELGNCWFVAACASIAEEKSLWKKIVPNYAKQEWDEKNEYTGIFHFRFYRMGQWYSVVIDDFLPTRGGSLVYCRSNQRNEFWSALLEKAYAKLFGDYQSLKAGRAMDALVDMMGGVGESIRLADFTSDSDRDKLFSLMEEGYDNHSLMSASISGHDYDTEQRLSTGLIATHAYSLTCVRNMKLGTGLKAFFKRERLRMVRCRNPWGKSEWTGPWSDSSVEWQNVSSAEKKKMGLVSNDDGEFWISFEDFCTHFTSMDICHLLNTNVFSLKKTWKEDVLCSNWQRPQRAGGCFNNPTKLDNPQFVFDVKETEGEVIISLEQEDARINKEYGHENATIGMTVCRADLNRKFRMHDALEKEFSTTFANSRSIFHRCELPKGRYLLVPSSFDPGHEGRFMLRVYAIKDPNLKELVRDAPKQGGCFSKKHRSAISVKMISAGGLSSVEKDGVDDPYCVVKVEGESVKTPYVKNTLNPEWNWRGTFYNKKVEPNIVVEVWDHNAISDKLIGRTQIVSGESAYNNEDTQNVAIYRGKEPDTIDAGHVCLKIKRFYEIAQA